MKPIYKHIIAAICALLIIAYMVFGLKMSHRMSATPVCAHLQVSITDEYERQYVTEDEIIRLVQLRSQNPVGKQRTHNTLQQIEQTVRQNSMIRTAECYYTMQGNVCIRLTQRVPIVRIFTNSETYYIDSDRKVMPHRPSVTTPVLQVYGDCSQRMATHEIADFAVWLDKQTYWKKRINHVEVSPHMIRIVQPDGYASILLGDWQNYEGKLCKLRHWYEAERELNLSQYPVVDVRFHGQVIGIKSVD